MRTPRRTATPAAAAIFALRVQRSSTAGILLFRNRWWHPPTGMPNSPGDHLTHERPEIFALWRQHVLHARRTFAVAMRDDHAVALQAFEPVGKNVRGNPLGRIQKVGEPPFATNEIADNEQCPAIAKHVERTRDRAARASRPSTWQPGP